MAVRKSVKRAGGETLYNVFTLRSWDGFLKAVTASPYSNWAFRGERHAQWPLLTALSRYFQNFKIHPQAWPDQELRILRVFKRKAHQYLAQPPALDDDFQWLALMQHHGAPTRLLDLTWSPYVAAFFALERARGESAVWAFNPVPLSANPGKRKSPTRPEMDPRLPGAYDRYFRGNRHAFIWLGEPHTMNRRLIAQSATFAMPGVLDVPIEDILSRYPDPKNMIVKFVLPAARIRDTGLRELYRMNITYATLFPDLDGLARSLAYELEFHWAYDPHTLQKLR